MVVPQCTVLHLNSPVIVDGGGGHGFPYGGSVVQFPCPLTELKAKLSDCLRGRDPFVALEHGERRPDANEPGAVLQRGPGDPAVQPDVGADAAGHNEGTIVALALEPAINEHGRVVVRERAQHRGEHAKIHHSPRTLAGLVTDEPRMDGEPWQLHGPGVREQRLARQRSDLAGVRQFTELCLQGGLPALSLEQVLVTGRLAQQPLPRGRLVVGERLGVLVVHDLALPLHEALQVGGVVFAEVGSGKRRALKFRRRVSPGGLKPLDGRMGLVLAVPDSLVATQPVGQRLVAALPQFFAGILRGCGRGPVLGERLIRLAAADNLGGVQPVDRVQANTIIVTRSLLPDGTPKPTKTDAGRRVVPLFPELRQLLLRWKVRSPFTDPDDYVLVTAGRGPLQQRNAQRALQKAKEAAGLDDREGRLSWHSLRHSAGSVWLTEFGLPVTTVSVLMGHTNPSFTLACYGRDPRDTETMVEDVLARAAAVGAGG